MPILDPSGQKVLYVLGWIVSLVILAAIGLNLPKTIRMVKAPAVLESVESTMETVYRQANCVRVRYRYTYDGKQYTGHNVVPYTSECFIVNFRTLGDDLAYRISREAESGKFHVYVDPEKPSFSALYKFEWAIGYLFYLVPVALTLFVFVRRRFAAFRQPASI
jgi:hypothetical protein